MKLIYNVYDEVQKKVARIFGPLEWMIPPWCKRVKIFTDSRCPDVINIRTKYDYREGSVRIGPDYWDYTDEAKKNLAKHELIHLTLCPLSDFTEHLIREKLEDDPFLRTMLTERVESVTEDIRTLLESSEVHARRSSARRVPRKIKAAKSKADVGRGTRED